MKYLSASKTSKKWDISAWTVQIICKEDRIPGAIHVGFVWAIPDNTGKPADVRIKGEQFAS